MCGRTATWLPGAAIPGVVQVGVTRPAHLRSGSLPAYPRNGGPGPALLSSAQLESGCKVHLAGSSRWPQDAPVADRTADSALLLRTSLPRCSVPAIRQSTKHIGRPTSACRQAMAQTRRGFLFACCVETYHFARYAVAGGGGAAERGEEVDGTTLRCPALTGPARAPATQPSAR